MLPQIASSPSLASDRPNASVALLSAWLDVSGTAPGRHCQLIGMRSRWRAIRTACPWLRRSGDAGDLGPNLKGLGPGGSIPGGWNVVAAEVDEVADPVVGGQEALRLPS